MANVRFCGGSWIVCSCEQACVAAWTLLMPAATGETLTPAIPTGPPVTPIIGAGESVLAELSFAAPAQPVPVDFFVQVVALDPAGPHIAFATYLSRSAILVEL